MIALTYLHHEWSFGGDDQCLQNAGSSHCVDLSSVYPGGKLNALSRFKDNTLLWTCTSVMDNVAFKLKFQNYLQKIRKWRSLDETNIFILTTDISTRILKISIKDNMPKYTQNSALFDLLYIIKKCRC